MLIKLNKHSTKAAHYVPPIPVGSDMPEPVLGDTPEQILEKLLWVPAMLVSRFLHQFPALHSESDELFSIGILTLTSLIERFSVEDVGRYATLRCTRAMEDYANSIDTVIYVNTTTRYKRRNQGRSVPVSIPVGDTLFGREDDHTALMLKDAAEHLDIDLDNMSRKDRKTLERHLR